MNKEKLGQEPAFPMDFEQRNDYQLGMSKRFYAAIALKVPDSGEEWLDEMIRKANRRDAACAALTGIMANSNPDFIKMDFETAVGHAYRCANHLLDQEDK